MMKRVFRDWWPTVLITVCVALSVVKFAQLVMPEASPCKCAAGCWCAKADCHPSDCCCNTAK